MQNLLITAASWTQIISSIVAIVALIIQLRSSRLRTQTRSLGIEIKGVWSPFLIRADEPYQENIEVRYKGRPVKDIFILQISVTNTGDLPIRRSHIVQPIRFAFRPDLELLEEPKVVDRKPENISFNWKIPEIGSTSGQTYDLEFDLLNPNEELTVEFVGIGQASLPKMTTRIEGVKELEIIDPYYSPKGTRRGLTRPLSLAVFWGLIAALLVNIVLLSRLTTGALIKPLDYFTGLATGFILAGVVGFMSQQLRFWMVSRRRNANLIKQGEIGDEG